MPDELDEKSLKARKLAALAVELRVAGKTFQQIADELGYSDRTGARRAVNRGIAQLGPSPKAKQLREQELLRLERLWAAYYPAAMKLQEHANTLDATQLANPEGAFDIQVSLNVGVLLLKISEARRKLCGLDAPWPDDVSGAPVTDLTDERLLQIAGKAADAPP